jgi:hemoglobin-like flavoprotein
VSFDARFKIQATMLTDRQVLNIKLSWSYISIRLDDFGAAFYKILFEMDPSLRFMFKGDMGNQMKKFGEMVNHIVSHMQSVGALEVDFNKLGESHAGIGVRTEHYDTVAIAFLLAMKKTLKRKMNEETQEAWTMAFSMIAQKMKNYRPAKREIN